MRLGAQSSFDQVSLETSEYARDKNDEAHSQRRTADNQRGLRAAFPEKANRQGPFKFHHKASSTVGEALTTRGRTAVPGAMAALMMTCSPSCMP